ncbi:LPS O-antigen length regulator Wzz(fepE) [Enterobacteriaceae bacterium H20N1]|uniref:LPS O-antigen length regulator Wzz(FepE) n=1 Tax=Dryocola boscaweniae TaxID=2925397 RepID=A0A9X2W8I5_9ENTR|nr:LPS O-antigen length regulator Wzz(fepE) [Dryocola boscaweniae]MCT4702760.1 LPS O-antigen length regulator Wzz(fepE) [Dryocola boscaweniae]MCT4719928.1 LPS O-antigen length regulator Wzz(fepE) [Dryocola boscaweniae]
MSSIEVKPSQLESASSYKMLSPAREEIDLLNLLATLFAARKQIVAITFVFILAGLAASFLLPQKWTSQAIITAPENEQMIELRRAMINMTVLGVGAKVEAGTIYNMFLKKFDSQTLREQFLAQSPYVQALLNNQEVDNSELHRAIISVSEKFKSLNNIDLKKTDNAPYSSWTLSFVAPDAGDAQQVLENYIQFITAEVKKDVLQDLKNAVELKIAFEKDKLQLDRTMLENQHNINVQRLGYSLQVANAAGIKKPVYSNGQAVKDDPDYSVALGADGLAEKLKIEQSIKDVAELNASMQNREHLLTQLATLNVGDVNFTPYKYQMQPSLPVKKDGPRRSLIIVLAAFLGLIVASGTVLMRHAIGSRMEMENPLEMEKII